MSKMSLDTEEKELLDFYEADEWPSIDDLETRAQTYQEYARATFRKDKWVNIRIPAKDLEALQKRALEEGLPYQTLMASILPEFFSGRLVERS